MNVIQGRLLISQYFLSIGRVLEGSYHLSGATSIVLSCGLHHAVIPVPMEEGTSSQQDITHEAHVPLLLELPQPVDITEKEERENLFWVAYSMDCVWSVFLQCPAGLSQATMGVQTDTLWSGEITQFQASGLNLTHEPRSLFELRGRVCTLLKRLYGLQSCTYSEFHQVPI